jgi:16S rRNA (cytidine1402-2'-O)-methyltransferase
MTVLPGTRLGELYLIPNLLGDTAPLDSSLPPLVTSVVSKLTHFVVEDEKNARHFIKHLCPERIIRELSITCLNEHTKSDALDALAAPLKAGHDIGIISEAGCPGIADPGAPLVSIAHEMGVKVHPLVGPCSMMLALMASGFNGQRWRFLGYLPIEGSDRKEAIRSMERELTTHNETQIVMDTPYRNQKLFEELISTCRPETKLCIAANLTCENESIEVKTVKDWRSSKPVLTKCPALFLLGA